MKTKYAQIWLPYFKQGDDLAGHLEGHKENPVAAFRAHAEQMKKVSDILNEIAQTLSQYPNTKIDVNAGTHHISILGPEEVITALIEKDLAQDFEDDEDFDEENE